LDLTPEFEWEFPEFAKGVDFDYDEKDNIEGKVITTEKPIKPGLRGITLFANGRMINLSEFFGSSESSHFFSYTTGWLDVDFVDDWEAHTLSNPTNTAFGGEKFDQMFIANLGRWHITRIDVGVKGLKLASHI